ncbi:MAG: hypothetical protein HIU83_17025 [Proteobacteria bacterium]|nr:hypothetical protein [Pseudomonadota bacterium]
MSYNVFESTGIETGFEYHHIFDMIEEAELKAYCGRLVASYAKLTKAWSTELNSIWLARHYLAIKMMLSSSVMLTSLEFAQQKNLRIVEPYLLYYSLLNCCRALTFTLPEQDWRQGGLLNMTHQKIINVTVDAIKKISKVEGDNASMMLDKSKEYRELFSYKFPANGIGSLSKSEIIQIEDAIRICAVICEISQVHSECLHFSLQQYVTNPVDVDMQILKKCFLYETNEGVFHDSEDWYRTNYFKRHKVTPWNLYWTAREGLVEDYFGSWCAEEPEEGSYDPDINWRIIFPFN